MNANNQAAGASSQQQQQQQQRKKRSSAHGSSSNKGTISGAQPQKEPHRINPLQEAFVRQRSDSTGSTRGAFYQGSTTPANAAHAAPKIDEVLLGSSSAHAKHQHHSQHQQQQQRRSSRKSKTGGSKPKKPTSMADVATLAMESLSPGELEPLPSTQPFARTHELSLHDDSNDASKPAPQKKKESKAAAARRAMMKRVEQQHRQQQQQQQQPTMATIQDTSDSTNLDYSEPGTAGPSSFFGSPNTKPEKGGGGGGGGGHSTARGASLQISDLQLSNSLDSGDSLRYSGAVTGMNDLGGTTPRKGDPYRREGSGLLGDSLLDSPRNSMRATGAMAQHHKKNQPSQQDEINFFSSLVQNSAAAPPPPPPSYGATHDSSNLVDDSPGGSKGGSQKKGGAKKKYAATAEASSGGDASAEDSDANDDDDDDSYAGLGIAKHLAHQVLAMLDPTEWLTRDVRMDDQEDYYFQNNYTLAALVRHFLFNPLSPEFTSLQQFVWACLIGIAMGFYTAGWKMFIELGVDFFWETVPEHLVDWGVFTDVEGSFPLYHYMWMCPAIFGGILSYIFVKLPSIPDQNQWINTVHARGVLDHSTFFPLFFLSTMGMWSGLSLGPELPLVLTAGMVGSWLALLTKQSMLQARVLNMTAASAAVGGFFGFPMAGALFVLEIPHRMGLQYFEALSPGTIASIIAVLVNRMLMRNDVTGYYSYPFLTTSLPSTIFTSSIVYGIYGCFIGIGYTHGTKFLKMWVHDWFHAPHDDHHHGHAEPEHHEKDLAVGDGSAESIPLVAKKKKIIAKTPPLTLTGCLKAYICLVIQDEAKRAAAAGIVAGAIVGVVGIFLPHTLFWGEAQLQNLIDKGRTPLPIFGEGNEPTAGFLSHAFCMIDPTDAASIRAGFGVGCSALIAISKIFVVGLSLGTGIIGGHFWGPLYVGCAASHLFSDLVKIFHERFGFGGGLAAYPCVVILCTMGSSHVVAFRAHMAIMLILTLTISAFDPEDENSPFDVAGDYSAVFPLLVVSVFISLMASRDTVFYPTQRSRGDITAVPEVLCQPGMQGAPLVVVHEQSSDDWSYDEDGGSYVDGESFTSDTGSDLELAGSRNNTRDVEHPLTQKDIENAFEAAKKMSPLVENKRSEVDPFAMAVAKEGGDGNLASARLDELLKMPVSGKVDKPKHRRVQSAPMWEHPAVSHSRTNSRDWGAVENPPPPPTGQPRSRTNSGGSQRDLMRVTSFGEIQEHQPSLMEQARMRAASSVSSVQPERSPRISGHRRVPSMPTHTAGRPGHKRVPSLPMGRSRNHSRTSSQNSLTMLNTLGAEPGALSVDDIQQSFDAVVNEKLMSKSPWSNNP